MISSVIAFFCGCIGFFIFFRAFVKMLNEFLKIKPDDMDIKATVLKIVYLGTGDIQPILQYNMDGVEKIYIYQAGCSPDKYAIGDEVILKCSKENGFVYDKEDLIKGLRRQFIITIIIMIATLFFFCDIWLELR
ncbi:MAG: hypothetical protein K2G89_01265 [Lachnospiraceae bacterium]|nr:hypothetical protein [Lachnospiraceae bacterium]